MKRALNECAITGIPTTVEFHLEPCSTVPEFINGDIHTKFVEQEMLQLGNCLGTAQQDLRENSPCCPTSSSRNKLINPNPDHRGDINSADRGHDPTSE